MTILPRLSSARLRRLSSRLPRRRVRLDLLPSSACVWSFASFKSFFSLRCLQKGEGHLEVV